MAEAPVVDASPLIFFSRTGDRGLLTVCRDPLVVPRPVAEEIRAKGAGDPVVAAVAGAPFLRIIEPPPVPPEISKWELGRGETAVLAWAAAHPDSTAILDDREARRCARSLAVPYTGTLCILLRAKQQGRIPTARPLVEELVASGMYLSKQVLDAALALVGE